MNDKYRTISTDESVELQRFGFEQLDKEYHAAWRARSGGTMLKAVADEIRAEVEIAGHLNRGVSIKDAVAMCEQANLKSPSLQRIANLCDRGKALELYASLELTKDSKTGYERAAWLHAGRLEKFVEKMQMLGKEGLQIQADFNGHVFYSDTITMDDAYLEVTGYTKEGFDKACEEATRTWEAERDAERKEMQELLPTRGREILAPEYINEWDRAVEIRTNDLYNGHDLVYALEVIEALNNGCSMEEAKAIFDKQNHSGMSYGLVLSEISSFCDRGEEFSDYAQEIEHDDRGPVIGE